MRTAYEPLGVTHGLMTKLDEVPVDPRVALTVAALGLPMRWIADGQEVPADLSDAGGRVLGSLGMARTLTEAA
jgi:flagellar biosynthesis protein FlhF